MKRRTKNILILSLILLVGLPGAGAIFYLTNAHCFGPVYIDSNTGVSITNVEGISPIGLELSLLNVKNDWFSEDHRFYRELHIQCKSTDHREHLIMVRYGRRGLEGVPIGSEFDGTLTFRFEKEPYPASRRVGDLFLFIAAHSWFWPGIYVLVGIILIVILFFFSKRWLKTPGFAERVRQRMSTPRFRGLISLGYTVIIVIGIYANLTIGTDHQKALLKDSISLEKNPDQLDYQVISVNLAREGLFPVSGFRAPYQEYCFRESETAARQDPASSSRFVRNSPALHRFPAYPFVLGLIYKVSGIHPLGIKILQLVLLSLMAFLLPLFGYRLRGSRGFLAGMITAAIILYIVAPMVDLLTPDIATIVINFFVIRAYVYYRKKTSWRPLIGLAFLIGLSFLVKSSLMFFLPLMILDLLIVLIKRRNKIILIQSISLLLISTLCWLPYNIWSICQFNKAQNNAIKLIAFIEQSSNPTLVNTELNKGTFGSLNKYAIHSLDTADLSTYHRQIRGELEQTGGLNFGAYPELSNNVVGLAFNKMATMHERKYFMITLFPTTVGMNCHNEFVTDGYENKLWPQMPRSFYNNDGLEGHSPLLRIFNFYKHNPRALFTVSYGKIMNVLDHLILFRHFPWMLFLWMAADLLLRKSLRSLGSRILASFYFLFGFTAMAISSFSVVFLPLALLIAIFNPGLRKIVPLPFLLLTATMIFFTLITVGVPRYGVYYYFPTVLGFFLLLFELTPGLFQGFAKAKEEPGPH